MSREQEASALEASKQDAEHLLDTILHETSPVTLENKASQASIESELDRERLVTAPVSDRQKSRLLVVASDTRILETGSMAQDFFKDLAPMFDEIHIIVCMRHKVPPTDSKRIAHNLWVYTTGHSFWWRAPYMVRALASEQLVFGGGFRADFVVGFDPFEAGAGAYLIAKKFQRPLQLHVPLPFWSNAFKRTTGGNVWRSRMANYILERTHSIRTTTADMKRYLNDQYKHANISLLPRHYDISEILKNTTTTEHADMFPQFSFVFLYVGELSAHSMLFRAIDAVRQQLVSPKVALVVVGDGPNKREFQERVKIYGITEQVIFTQPTKDLIPYLTSADVLICPDTTDKSEELVIKAAAAGLPMILAKTALRQDLFTDGKEAFLCDPEDTVEFMHKVGSFINRGEFRKEFAQSARYIVTERLHDDPNAYRAAFRDSLESVFNQPQAQ